MVVFNYSTRELTTKIVYYGPGLCGKTTNLQFIYDNMPQGVRGKMLSLATKSDRTLFFDFLPIDLGEIQGMKTKVQLYTVPGQVFYNETRRLVLKGADGVVFVADSQENMLDANLDSYRNLEENLRGHGLDLAKMPHVLQFNKQDLPNAMGVEPLNEKLNKHNAPFYEAVATTGVGVQETLRHISKLVLLNLNERYAGQRAPARQEPSMEAPPAAEIHEAPAPVGVPEMPPAAVAAEVAPVAAAAQPIPAAVEAPAVTETPAAELPSVAAAPLETPSTEPSPAFTAQSTLVDQPAVSAPPAPQMPELEFDSAFEAPVADERPSTAYAIGNAAAQRPVPPPTSAPRSAGRTEDVFGVSPQVPSPAEMGPTAEDVLDIPQPAAPRPPDRGGATLKIDRRELEQLQETASAPAPPPVPAPVAKATAVEVAPHDPLFQEEGVAPTRLAVGQPQEILVPLELETPQGVRRFRLTLNLDLVG